MDAMLAGGGGLGQGYGLDSGGSGDANAALAELDQGLRCGRLGEQSEAIVRFPRLFAKYPFPILINSALLKLADIFRQSGNFTKLCVLRVVEQSERHLDKVTNVDELVKRISTVLHSNDPVARALTLRLLGAISVIIPERKQVHHCVRTALDSHDSDVELKAAIYAASNFAANSVSFSVNVCSKLSEMIRRDSTPVDKKLDLMSVFQNMRRLDAATATLVRSTCIELLAVYPSLDFVLVALHTLTLLSAHSLVDVPDQVELLLGHLNRDPRKEVKRQTVDDLKYLASSTYAHLWSEENVLSTVSFAMGGAKGGAVLCGALDISSDLVRSVSIAKFNIETSESPVLQLCRRCAYSKKIAVVVRGTLLFTLLASNCAKEAHRVDGMDISSEATMAIEALFLLINSGRETRLTGVVLKECLQSVVMLCRVQPEACDQFVDVVGGLLPVARRATRALLCEVLAALGHMKEGVLNLLLPDLCNMIMDFPAEAEGSTDRAVMNLLGTLLLQSVKNRAWTEETRSAIGRCLEWQDNWSAYRLCRTATRYGHHDVAEVIFEKLAGTVASEPFYFWLTGLSQVCRGEKIVNGLDPQHQDVVDRLTVGNKHILKGWTSIKASTSPAKNQDFKLELLRCRSEMLRTICQTVVSCNSIRTSPPPAIASSQAKQSHDDLQKCGRITSLLRQCVGDFSAVASMYGSLYETSFDADDDSLVHLQLLQHICLCVSQWIEMVCLKSSLQGTIFDDLDVSFSPTLPKPISEYGIDIKGLVLKGEEIASVFRGIVDRQTPPPITNIHVECLHRAMELLGEEPICFPRFFYQSLQTTSIKLAVTPQPRAANEPISISTSQHVAIKVEGVITSTTAVSFRQIDFIKLSLKSSLQTASAKAPQPNDVMQSKVADCDQTLQQTVAPHNDFFAVQFLLPFPVAGTHTVVIDTKVVDKDERTWRQNGLCTVLNIKAYEDGHSRTQASRR